jgi:SAM-dependent methyltransferase
LKEPPNYEDYDFTKMWIRRDLVNLAEMEMVRRLAGKPGRCLDMAGGFGRISSILENVCSENHLIDFSALNTGFARSTLRKTHVLQGNIFDLPYENDYFDLVILMRVMHHIENPHNVYREIMRVARNGASVIISVPNVSLGRFRRLEGIELVGRGDNGHEIFAGPLKCYFYDGLDLESIHGLGLFDNALGRMVNSLKFLYMIDIYTSRLWFLKNNIILNFRVRKPLNANAELQMLKGKDSGKVVT